MTESPFSERFRTFDENYKYITEKIAVSAERSGRSASDITLLAATKTVPVEVINYGIAAGLTCVGENRVQELEEKYPELDKEHCDVQFIGRLQTNKVKYLMGKVSCIQSVDSIKLAKEISRQCVLHDTSMNILVEVNIGREESKGGIVPEALYGFIDEARMLRGINVRGLMAIPPVSDNENELFKYFSAMKQYFVDIRAKTIDNVIMEHLSMGMSSDFPLAIECGATLVRVGSALFGKREYN